MNANFRIGRKYKFTGLTPFAVKDSEMLYEGYDKINKKYLFRDSFGSRQVTSSSWLLRGSWKDTLHIKMELYNG